MAKDGSIYLLSREINGDKGEVFMQNVTVFATSQTHATAMSPPTRRSPSSRSTRSSSTSTR